MSKAFNDPSLLTKYRLKKELQSNGVKLPRGEQKKEFYVNLYRENLSPQSESGGRRLGNGEFSSDDDDYESPQSKQIVSRASRVVKKVGSKEIVSSDIKSMSDEELKVELSSLGHPVGPIMPSTRGLYERKLARFRASTPNNSGTITTIEKSEFSDFSEEEQQDEESIPEDEFFYKGHDQNRRSGDTFGSTFSKNFQDSSSKKEVSRDFSVSSSRNVERSSTVDRTTMNKVRTKKGDKFEEKSWSSSPDNDKNEDEAIPQLSGLPANVQKALTSARMYSPEKENGTELRARPSRQQQPEEVPETTSQASVVEEKPKNKASRKWLLLIIFALILLLLTAAVVYNLERLPAIKKQLASLQGQSKSSTI